MAGERVVEELLAPTVTKWEPLAGLNTHPQRAESPGGELPGRLERIRFGQTARALLRRLSQSGRCELNATSATANRPISQPSRRRHTSARPGCGLGPSLGLLESLHAAEGPRNALCRVAQNLPPAIRRRPPRLMCAARMGSMASMGSACSAGRAAPGATAGCAATCPAACSTHCLSLRGPTAVQPQLSRVDVAHAWFWPACWVLPRRRAQRRRQCT